MSKKHGVYVYEQPTSIVPPIQVDSAIQVVIGTAPINLGEVNEPLTPKIAYSYDEAVKKIGFSKRLMDFTLCQSIKLSFEVYNVCPVIFINVLDPKKHTKTVENVSVTLADGRATIAQEGIVLSNLTVKLQDASDNLEAEKDFTASFDSDGFLQIEAVSGGAINTQNVALTVSYKCLDPTQVVVDDVLAGIRKVAEVYPRFGVLPGILLCPGWSHRPEVYAALTALAEVFNSMFRCFCGLDIDMDEAPAYDKCNTVKNKNGVTSAYSNLHWPMARIGDDIYYLSAIFGPHMAYEDYKNEGVPYVSPSNKALKISGLCDKQGKEIVLDIEQANLLNSQGICTGLNFNGWRYWGNYTAAYPSSTDPKDVFIPVRRMFSWWANTFILTYFSKVDNPMNKRLIEAIVDSENIRANGLKARYQIADAHIEYRAEENPETDLLNGTIRFHQFLTPYPPAQAIINTLEFDPKALSAALE